MTSFEDSFMEYYRTEVLKISQLEMELNINEMMVGIKDEKLRGRWVLWVRRAEKVLMKLLPQLHTMETSIEKVLGTEAIIKEVFGKYPLALQVKWESYFSISTNELISLIDNHKNPLTISVRKAWHFTSLSYYEGGFMFNIVPPTKHEISYSNSKIELFFGIYIINFLIETLLPSLPRLTIKFSPSAIVGDFSIDPSGMKLVLNGKFISKSYTHGKLTFAME